MVLTRTRTHRLRRLTWVIRGGVVMTFAGVVWAAWPQQEADAAFRPSVSEPAFTTARPRMVIDEGHGNLHTASGRYQPFARLMERDGLRVDAAAGAITPDVLRATDIYVTANALGYRGMAQMVADRAGLDRLVRFEVDAFADVEIATLARWVEEGGRALIVADHAPAAQASRRLAAAFGVEMTTWWLEDTEHADPDSGNPATLLFSRQAGLLAAHPILDGRHARERIDRVMTFTGQALRPGPHGTALLVSSPTARDYPYRASRDAEGRSAAGLAQAVAVTFGAGRVVVLGEAAALTAQRIEIPGGTPLLLGMNRSGIDNQQFALNIVRWLMGVLP